MTLRHATRHRLPRRLLRLDAGPGAALARAGRAAPRPSAEIDFLQIAEEIEDPGRSELNAVRSLIRRILVHLIKAAADPGPPAIRRWASEALAFQVELRDHFAPSMLRRIDMADLWQRALELAQAKLAADGVVMPPDLPRDCPFSVADFTGRGPFDPEAALERLLAARTTR